jgi:hypothetical protein
MSIIETPGKYRYHEIAEVIIRNIVQAAFIACRYVQQPDESPEKYGERLWMTVDVMCNTYVNDISKALETMVVSPEEPYDLYEHANDEMNKVLYEISRELAWIAYELDINVINEYFNSLPQSRTFE